MFILRPDFTEQQTSMSSKGGQASSSPSSSVQRSWLTINLGLAALANLLFGIVNYSYIGLYPTFLKTQLDFSASLAAFAQGMYGIGAFAGPISGYIADRLGERRVIMFAGMGTAASGLLMFLVATQPWQQDILSIFFGVFGSGFLFVNVYALTQRVVEPQHIGKASGVASSSHYIGAGFAGAIMGVLVSSFGWTVAAAVHFGVLSLLAVIVVSIMRVRTGGTEAAT